MMSYIQNHQGEGWGLHGGYWGSFDGNNFSNANRRIYGNNFSNTNGKRNRKNHYPGDFINFNDYRAKYWEHGGHSNFMRADHANYVKHDIIPSSLKRRKQSGSTWEENQRYHLPPPIIPGHGSSSTSYQNPTPSKRSNASTTVSGNCQRDISGFEGDELIFMSRDDIDRYSPSRKDGIDALHETHLRYSYCAFLRNLGTRLQLPHTTIGTAMVLCHRFFVRRSHACHDRFLIATATLFLSAKSEETPRPLNNVLRASSELLHKQDFSLLSYQLPVDWFEQYRERVLEAEQLLLTTLNFELNVEHPYDPLTSILNKLGLSHTDLVNLALNLVNEGLRSSLWLQFKPHHIAAGATHLAAVFLNMDLADYRNIWQEFQTTPSIVQDVTQQLMELF